MPATAGRATVPVRYPPPISVPPQYSMTGRPPACDISQRMSSAEEHSPVELNTRTVLQSKPAGASAARHVLTRLGITPSIVVRTSCTKRQNSRPVGAPWNKPIAAREQLAAKRVQREGRAGGDGRELHLHVGGELEDLRVAGLVGVRRVGWVRRIELGGHRQVVASGVSGGSTLGSSTVKVVPSPGCERTSTRPPERLHDLLRHVQAEPEATRFAPWSTAACASARRGGRAGRRRAPRRRRGPR